MCVVYMYSAMFAVFQGLGKNKTCSLCVLMSAMVGVLPTVDLCLQQTLR